MAEKIMKKRKFANGSVGMRKAFPHIACFSMCGSLVPWNLSLTMQAAVSSKLPDLCTHLRCTRVQLFVFVGFLPPGARTHTYKSMICQHRLCTCVLIVSA